MPSTYHQSREIEKLWLLSLLLRIRPILSRIRADAGVFFNRLYDKQALIRICIHHHLVLTLYTFS